MGDGLGPSWSPKPTGGVQFSGLPQRGKVAERSKALVLKTRDLRNGIRGFESYSSRRSWRDWYIGRSSRLESDQGRKALAGSTPVLSSGDEAHVGSARRFAKPPGTERGSESSILSVSSP